MQKYQRVIFSVFLALFLIPYGYLMLDGWGLWITRYRLSQQGEVVQGVVVDAKSVRYRKMRYFLTYQYLPKGGVEMLEQEREVAQTFFEHNPIGTSVLVYYLPSNLESSNLAGNDLLQVPSLGLQMKLTVVTSFTIFVIGFLYLFKRLR